MLPCWLNRKSVSMMLAAIWSWTAGWWATMEIHPWSCCCWIWWIALSANLPPFHCIQFQFTVLNWLWCLYVSDSVFCSRQCYMISEVLREKHALEEGGVLSLFFIWSWQMSSKLMRVVLLNQLSPLCPTVFRSQFSLGFKKAAFAKPSGVCFWLMAVQAGINWIFAAVVGHLWG